MSQEQLNYYYFIIQDYKFSIEFSGAVASTAVKLKLRECLLNKSHRELRNSGDSSPEFRQWFEY